MECVSLPDRPASFDAASINAPPIKAAPIDATSVEAAAIGATPIDSASADPAPPDPPTEPLAVVAPSPADGLATTPWTFVDVFAGLGAVLLLSLLIGAPLKFADVQGGSSTLLLGVLPIWLGLFGTAWWASRRHGTGNLIRDLALHFRPIDLAIGLGVGLGLRFVIGVWAVAYSAVTGQQPTGNLEPILGGGLGTGLLLVLNVLAIAVIGPAIEEIYFRGLGLRSALASLWRRAEKPRFADPKRRVRYALAATSAVFALLHVSELTDFTSAAVLLPGLFFSGWVFGWLTIRYGRLGPAVVSHVVFNATAVLALLLLP